MPKKFTSKPIRSPKKLASNELNSANEVADFSASSAADKKLEDFYENGGPEIQKPNTRPTIWGLVILISMLFGFGSALAYDFLFDNTPQLNGNQKVIIEKQEDVTVTSEERLTEIADNINPVVVNFYNNSDKASGPFYQDIYSLGNGFILTSDGWIATTQSVMDKIGDKEYIILTEDYKVYKAEKVLTDPISPVVFVKIKAKDLPVAKLGERKYLQSGQKVYGFIANYPEPKIASLNLADLQTPALEDVVASSEEFSHFISAREGYNPSLAGAPMVNLSGEIVAIVNNTQTALPVSYLKTAINDLSKKEKIDRAYLGVHYINLSKYPKIDPATGGMRDKGALLSGFKNLLAVEKRSPASKAGLRVGDIILTIEDVAVNGQETLTQMIQEYNEGDKIKITYLRNGKERAIEVLLGKID